MTHIHATTPPRLGLDLYRAINTYMNLRIWMFSFRITISFFTTLHRSKTPEFYCYKPQSYCPAGSSTAISSFWVLWSNLSQDRMALKAPFLPLTQLQSQKWHGKLCLRWVPSLYARVSRQSDWLNLIMHNLFYVCLPCLNYGFESLLQHDFCMNVWVCRHSWVGDAAF